MIKMVVEVWKKPEMSYEDFRTRWLDVHGPLVRERAGAMGFVRYVQSHKIPSPEVEEFARVRGWKTSPDGTAEVWWLSEESMKAALGSPEGIEANEVLIEDEKCFIDTKRMSAFLADEKVIFDFE